MAPHRPPTVCPPPPAQETYKSDPRQPHVIVCGDINTSRLKAFLAQFFHKCAGGGGGRGRGVPQGIPRPLRRSRDPVILSPIVILSDQKYEGPLRALIEQHRYAGARTAPAAAAAAACVDRRLPSRAGSVTYVRGNARRPADLKRGGCPLASTVIVLCNRSGITADAAIEADAEVVSACLAIKAVNRRVRVLAQVRRERGSRGVDPPYPLRPLRSSGARAPATTSSASRGGRSRTGPS